MKTGLVLEGGAMRGMFTAGVLDVLMEEKIEFPGAVGVSAGAVFGCNYKSKQNGRVIRYNTAYCKDPRYCSFRSLLKTGDLFGADFCYRELPQTLDIFDMKTYRENPMEFYVVSTDCETGKPVYHKCETAGEKDLEWMRGSASMPLCARIVEVDGYKLLDGGISDSIPLRYFEGIGYEKNVVVLTQPRGYRKSPNKAMPLMRRALRQYPNVLRAMENRHNVYNETVQYVFKKEKEGDAFVICPPEKLPIGHVEHNAEKLRTVYEIGRREAKRCIRELKIFMAK